MWQSRNGCGLNNFFFPKLEVLINLYDIQVGFHNPYQDSVSAMRLYKRMCSQDHPMVGVSNTPDLSFIGSCDPWRTVAHERMTIEELLAISRANYECWCLDSPM
ncbi:hypothetical protein BC332_23875 [Capsicum chinense]|nr:hypothetical protein BC332_23875 [Capsicum chinense]